jgi:energy-coupling factor transport system ATP-binding protein
VSLVELRAVGHVYDAGTPWQRRALAGVDLEVETGDAVVIIGDNGSGKSTLFKILIGALAPTQGQALLDGRPLRKNTAQVGGCMQRARLQLFGVTLAEDLRLDHTVTEVAARSALYAVGLDPARFWSRRIEELSGGEQRLVALAGALARRPRLLVLDEPLAGVDAAHAGRLRHALRSARREGAASVMLTPRRSDLDIGGGGRVLKLDAGRLTAAEWAGGGRYR